MRRQFIGRPTSFLLATILVPTTFAVCRPLVPRADYTAPKSAGSVQDVDKDRARPSKGGNKKPGGQQNNAPGEQISRALRIGEVFTARDGITAKIVELVSDSRCPADVDCVWAGNAAIKVRLSKKGVEPRTVQLNTTIEPREVVYAGRRIALADVAPYPNSKIQTQPKEYTISLRFLPLVDKVAKK